MRGVDDAGVERRGETGDVIGGRGGKAVHFHSLHGESPGRSAHERRADRRGQSGGAAEAGQHGERTTYGTIWIT